MSLTLPDRVDPWRAAKAGVRLSGTLALRSLPRLTEAVAADAGDLVSYELVFGRDAEGRSVVRGRLRTELRLRCERCLGEVTVPVDARLSLALLPSEHGVAELPSDLDPWVVGEESLRPGDLIEDELLLAIPVVPMHDPGACEPPLVADEGRQPLGERKCDDSVNPFAVLAELKGQGGG